MSLTNESLVLYSDGGSDTSGLAAGWGFHGYRFIPDLPKQGSGCPKGILTEKGYSNKDPNSGNKHPIVTILKYVDGFGSILDGTNNVAELVAATEALKYVLDNQPKSVLIFIDSKYVINGLMQWSDNWIKNNWKKPDGTEYSNKELWIPLIDIKNQILEQGIQLDVQWVKGHSDDIGNDLADELATWGKTLARKKMEYRNIRESEGKGYWNKTFTYNRMIDKSSWYFNSYHPCAVTVDAVQTPQGQYIYYLGDHGPDVADVGKAVSDSSFSVLYLKEMVGELAVVRDYQNQLNEHNFKNLVVGKVGNILSSNTMEVINHYGNSLLSNDHSNKNIILNDSLLTVELKPPLLAKKAVDSLIYLESLLVGFIDNPERAGLVVTEITDIFYSAEIKGKKSVTKLLPEINSSLKKINIKGKYNTLKNVGEIEVPLILGIDTPGRNALSALAEFDPRFYLITWKESENAFRYATVLEANGDIGIWAGVYSNIRLLLP